MCTPMHGTLAQDMCTLEDTNLGFQTGQEMLRPLSMFAAAERDTVVALVQFGQVHRQPTSDMELLTVRLQNMLSRDPSSKPHSTHV